MRSSILALPTMIIGMATLQAEVASFQGLGTLPEHEASCVSAVSADGSVVVGSSYGDTQVAGSTVEAFRWTVQGGMIGLGLLTGCQRSRAWDVSPDGSVVVGLSDRVDVERQSVLGTVLRLLGILRPDFV